jgi:predicted transcriptional regulator
MDTFYNVLFEISNEDRHRILLQLDKESMNVTQLSKKLDLTLTETSRHLSRIVKVGIVSKEADGKYQIKPFGRLFLNLLQGVEFISKHRDYFNSHSLARLPQEFKYQIGNLSNSSKSNDVMVVLYKIEKLIEEAEEYVWEITHEYPGNTYQLETEAYGRGIHLKCIQPESWVPSPQLEAAVRPEDREAISKAWINGLLEVKTLKQLDIFLYMSEKEVAIVGFPNIKGQFDYLGFSSKDQKAHKWCLDLCNYYWENAKPKRKLYFS